MLLVQLRQQKGLEAFTVEVLKATELFFFTTLVAACHWPESDLAGINAIIRTEQIHPQTLDPPSAPATSSISSHDFGLLK